MKPVQAIFFDLDNTLFDDDASIRLSLARVHADICGSLPGIDALGLASAYLVHSDAYWGLQPYARADVEDVRRGLWQKALADLGCDDLDCAIQAADSYRRGRHEIAELYDDAIEVLDGLRERCRLAVITNGSGLQQRQRLESIGLAQHFEVIVASTDLDTGKPEPAIFHHVLSRMGLDPADVWHVGDSLIHDVAGAHNAGLTAVWLNRLGAVREPDQPRPHHEIASLRELQGLLRSLS